MRIDYLCKMIMNYTSLEICAGAGGQALGLEQAGFHHLALVEIEKDYCDCLKRNRPSWNVICQDIHSFSGLPYRDKVDLLAGGVPCPPFSVAGKQLGKNDERDLFPEMLRLIKEINPRIVMIENVRGFLGKVFDGYRAKILNEIRQMGYTPHVKLLNASDYGVPQLRPRTIIISVRNDIKDIFSFPYPLLGQKETVGDAIYDLISANGWKHADEWRKKANRVAPTIVGGSKKHGGPDLGPTRAKREWAEMSVDGKGIANEAPAEDFEGLVRLTPRMIARIQGFPDDWDFGQKKTAACRMIGNAFPPPVAKKVGEQIIKVLDNEQINEHLINSQSQRAIS